MSALLPFSADCCDVCEEPLSVAIPGPEGPPGGDCEPCTDGINAFTLAESFVMPAELANVIVTVLNSDWMAPGQIIWARGGGGQGYFEVQSKPDSTSVILKNLEDTANSLYLTNSPPATVFPALTLVVAGGLQGPIGLSGTALGPTVLLSPQVDFKTLATASIATPAGYAFFVEECFIIADTVTGLVSQPAASFGGGANPTKYVNNNLFVSLTTSVTRERLLVSGTEGELTLTAQVDTVASATTFLGKFGFKGVMYLM